MSENALSLQLHANNWQKTTIGRQAIFIKDGTHGTHQRVNNGIPLLSATNITESGKIEFNTDVSRVSLSDYKKIHSKYELQIGDLLVTIVGTLGRRALVTNSCRFTIQRSVGIIRTKAKKLDPRFLYQFTGSEYFQKQLVLRSNATAQAGVYLGELEKIDIAVPPIPEQQKIAAILTSVDDVIEETEAQINKLQDLKKGMMQELLTKGIGHTEFKDSPVGRIPKGWEICNLEEVCTRIGVGIASSTTHAYTNSGVPIIRNQNIREGELDSSDLLFITEKFSKENESKKIKEGDVLTIRTGYPGVSAVVPSRFHNCHSFTTLISTPRHDVLDSEYLALWVNSDYGRKFVLGGQAGGAQQNLNVSILKQLLVLLPRLDEQKEITNSINSLHAKTKLIGRKLEYYANIKKALMQDLLTGKVRVKVD
jgi:type I restriction enzyme S subunit